MSAVNVSDSVFWINEALIRNTDSFFKMFDSLIEPNYDTNTNHSDVKPINQGILIS